MKLLHSKAAPISVALLLWAFSVAGAILSTDWYLCRDEFLRMHESFHWAQQPYLFRVLAWLPGFMVLYGLLLKLGLPLWGGSIAITIGLGVLCLAVLWQILERLFVGQDRRWVWVGLLLYATTPLTVQLNRVPLSETLYVLLLLINVWFWLEWLKNPKAESAWGCALFGLCMGTVRQEGWIACGLIFLASVWHLWQERKGDILKLSPIFAIPLVMPFIWNGLAYMISGNFFAINEAQLAKSIFAYNERGRVIWQYALESIGRYTPWTLLLLPGVALLPKVNWQRSFYVFVLAYTAMIWSLCLRGYFPTVMPQRMYFGAMVVAIPAFMILLMHLQRTQRKPFIILVSGLGVCWLWMFHGFSPSLWKPDERLVHSVEMGRFVRGLYDGGVLKRDDHMLAFRSTVEEYKVIVTSGQPELGLSAVQDDKGNWGLSAKAIGKKIAIGFSKKQVDAGTLAKFGFSPAVCRHHEMYLYLSSNLTIPRDKQALFDGVRCRG